MRSRTASCAEGDRLVADEDLRSRGAAIGEAIRAKDGIRRAADLIEEVGRRDDSV